MGGKCTPSDAAPKRYFCLPSNRRRGSAKTNRTRSEAIDPIVGHLREALSALGGSRPVLSTLADADVVESLSGRMDPGHSVVLRGVLDTGTVPGTQGHPDLIGSLSVRFSALSRENGDKLAALRRDIPERYGETILAQRLQEGGWYQPDPWSTTGRGSRKDLRSVYLLCYRELLAETERILVHVQSRCDHLDDLASRQWLEGPLDNAARIGACLAEGLRTSESERLRAWRTALGRIGEDAFCSSMAGKWEKTTASSRAGLHQLVARPWATPRQDGFQGFAHRLLDLVQALSNTMVWLSRSRWELHLRPQSANT
jgi:hypothetical protein